MLDLSDFTFCIPLKIDSPERQENLSVVLSFFSRHVRTSVIIGEEDTTSHVVFNTDNTRHLFVQKSADFFHHTRLLNKIYEQVSTPFAVNYDVDVLVPIKSLQTSAMLLRQRRASIVQPFNGVCYKCPRHFLKEIETACITYTHFYNHQFEYSATSLAPGGVLMFSLEDHIKAGGENEQFKAWGPEDRERLVRWEKLGLTFLRLPGLEDICYHLNHPVTVDSGRSNPYLQHNEQEFNKVQSMSSAQLKSYIATWSN